MPNHDAFGPGDVVAGRYEILERIGRGGFGTVYRARHRDLGADVALKVLNPELAANELARERFLAEVRNTTSFVHKYAVQLREFGHDPARGCLYFTMDLVQGETLGALLARERSLAPARAIALAGQVLEALAEAHDAGLVHRDLKPENLLVTAGRDGNEEVRVLDFGIAKAVAASRDSTSALTAAGTTLGTLFYMSPEQDEGKKLDGRSDLYSLGVIVYECLSGRRPIEADPEAENQVQSFHFRLSTLVPEPLSTAAPHVGPALSAAVATALAKAREARFATARDMRAALLGALEGRGELATATGLATGAAPAARSPAPATATGLATGENAAALPATPAPRPRGRRALVAMALLAIAGGLGAGAWLALPALTETPVPVVVPPRAIDPREARFAAQRRGLVVRTRPEGALVLLDDRRALGKAPLGVEDVAPGRHRLVASLEGHEEKELAIELRPEARLEVALELDPWRGTLVVEAPDGTRVEAAPRAGGPPTVAEARGGVARLDSLVAGPWRLQGTRAGHEPAAAEAEVRRRRETRVTLSLRERPGTLVVRSSPTALSVKLDGKVVGETPVTREGLSPGEHEVFVQAEGPLWVARRVRVRGDETTIVAVDAAASVRARAAKVASVEWARADVAEEKLGAAVASLAALVEEYGAAAPAWTGSRLEQLRARVARLEAVAWTRGELDERRLVEASTALTRLVAELGPPAPPWVAQRLQELDARIAARVEGVAWTRSEVPEPRLVDALAALDALAGDLGPGAPAWVASRRAALAQEKARVDARAARIEAIAWTRGEVPETRVDEAIGALEATGRELGAEAPAWVAARLEELRARRVAPAVGQWFLYREEYTYTSNRTRTTYNYVTIEKVEGATITVKSQRLDEHARFASGDARTTTHTLTPPSGEREETLEVKGVRLTCMVQDRSNGSGTYWMSSAVSAGPVKVVATTKRGSLLIELIDFGASGSGPASAPAVRSATRDDVTVTVVAAGPKKTPEGTVVAGLHTFRVSVRNHAAGRRTLRGRIRLQDGAAGAGSILGRVEKDQTLELSVDCKETGTWEKWDLAIERVYPY